MWMLLVGVMVMGEAQYESLSQHGSRELCITEAIDLGYSNLESEGSNYVVLSGDTQYYLVCYTEESKA